MVMVMVIGAGEEGVNSEAPGSLRRGDRSGYAMNNLKPGLDRGHTLAGSLGISVEDKRGEGEAGEEAGVGGMAWPAGV